MTTKEIFAKASASDIIEELKKRTTPAPNTSDFEKQWNIEKHDIIKKNSFEIFYLSI